MLRKWEHAGEGDERVRAITDAARYAAGDCLCNTLHDPLPFQVSNLRRIVGHDCSAEDINQFRSDFRAFQFYRLSIGVNSKFGKVGK